MVETYQILTFKLVATLLGLIHAIGELGHLWQDIVQLSCLSLTLYDDWEHCTAGYDSTCTRDIPRPNQSEILLFK